MQSELFARARALFEQALDVAAPARATWVAQATPADPELRAAVLELLRADATPDPRLEPPAPGALLERLAEGALQLAAGAQVGDFTLEERLGAGGMGVVWRARQTRPQRAVAVKLMSVALTGSGARERFLAEAELLGRLAHPGIATVLAAGLHSVDAAGARHELPWLALELVEGARDLAADARERHLDVAARVRRVIDACAALHHAHLRGVVHLDLKPANVLVGNDGRVRVIDFGIAQLAGAAAGTTRSGGTPGYMAPEQQALGAHELDLRCDVHALGALLHELLAGAPPGSAPLPAALAPDLHAIVARALHVDREARYDSAAALADDLRRFLALQPVAARPRSVASRAALFMRRRAGLVALSAVALVALLAALRFALDAAEESRRAARISGEAASAARAQLAEVLRFSDALSVDALLASEGELWPAWPERLADLEQWRDAAATLLARVPAQRATHAAAAAEAPSPEQRWRLATSQRLLQRLDSLAAAAADVTARIDAARTIAATSIDAVQERWDEVQTAVALDPRFEGLELSSQLGLLPLGPDPRSELQEFHVVGSGREPARALASGELSIDVECGVVLVLIPGGRFTMGAQAERPGAAGYDPDCNWDEAEPHEVEVGPFFLAKHELTQAQWVRLAGSNPALYSAQNGYVHPRAEMRPVETVAWSAAVPQLKKLGLVLPTEAQWEWAARAGSDTAWWCGKAKESVRDARAGNVADAGSLRRSPGLRWPATEPWDDGETLPAPIGSFAPNPFGLHDVIGNVFEHTRDAWGSYRDTTVAAGDGLRTYPPPAAGARPSATLKAARGGCYLTVAHFGRCSARYQAAIDGTYDGVGIRPARAIRE